VSLNGRLSGRLAVAKHAGTAVLHTAACAFGRTVRRLAGMARGGTLAVAAAGGLAGLGYYLVVTGKLTIDTGWGLCRANTRLSG